MLGDEDALELGSSPVVDFFDHADRGRRGCLREICRPVRAVVDQHRGASICYEVAVLAGGTAGGEKQVAEGWRGGKTDEARVGFTVVVGPEYAEQLTVQQLAKDIHVVETGVHC